jgi:hypothetical protein
MIQKTFLATDCLPKLEEWNVWPSVVDKSIINDVPRDQCRQAKQLLELALWF